MYTVQIVYYKHNDYITSDVSCNLVVYSRALVLMPEVQTLEGVGADGVRTGVVGNTQLLQVAGHSGLTPLGAVHRRW